jgi:hypothetical protein
MHLQLFKSTGVMYGDSSPKCIFGYSNQQESWTGTVCLNASSDVQINRSHVRKQFVQMHLRLFKSTGVMYGNSSSKCIFGCSNNRSHVRRQFVQMHLRLLKSTGVTYGDSSSKRIFGSPKRRDFRQVQLNPLHVPPASAVDSADICGGSCVWTGYQETQTARQGLMGTE